MTQVSIHNIDHRSNFYRYFKYRYKSAYRRPFTTSGRPITLSRRRRALHIPKNVYLYSTLFALRRCSVAVDRVCASPCRSSIYCPPRSSRVRVFSSSWLITEKPRAALAIFTVTSLLSALACNLTNSVQSNWRKFKQYFMNCT